MKTLNIISFLLLIFAFGCKKDPPVEPKEPKDKYDPNVMPPLTHTGENTFGCYIDGELFVAGGGTSFWDIPAISGSYDESTKKIVIQGTRYLDSLISDNVKIRSFVLDGPGVYEYTYNVESGSRGYTSWGMSRCNYTYESKPDFDLGKITITYLNEEENIIAGTFYINLINSDCDGHTILKITDGRFDFRY
ncbi:hypothetical protein [Crocinitomix catalasitica]|uniref:hypothetical protein n=1 Tax=Crocinitomix catalasitica TaxID=184607 RepID=UPI00047F84B0|nr:hypothetical protein [Crocinitomix catalasitica]